MIFIAVFQSKRTFCSKQLFIQMIYKRKKKKIERNKNKNKIHLITRLPVFGKYKREWKQQQPNELNGALFNKLINTVDCRSNSCNIIDMTAIQMRYRFSDEF